MQFLIRYQRIDDRVATDIAGQPPKTESEVYSFGKGMSGPFDGSDTARRARILVAVFTAESGA